MVDALVSGASAARRAGSSPVLGTVKSRNSLKIKSCGISLLIFVLLLSSYFNFTDFSAHSNKPVFRRIFWAHSNKPVFRRIFCIF